MENNKTPANFTVLVVDDSLVARLNIIKILKTADHEVIEATGGVDALEKLELHHPDCMILDKLMPDMDGLGVLKALQEKKTDDSGYYRNRRHTEDG